MSTLSPKERSLEGLAGGGHGGRAALEAVNVLGKVRDHLARIVADDKLAQREMSDLVHRGS